MSRAWEGFGPDPGVEVHVKLPSKSTMELVEDFGELAEVPKAIYEDYVKDIKRRHYRRKGKRK